MTKQLNAGQRGTTKSCLSKQSQSNTFGGSGETTENSLATEKGCFWQIRERNKKGFNHQSEWRAALGKVHSVA